MDKKIEKEENIKWHPAFYSALQLEFYNDSDKLEFVNEYQLSKEPLRIDVRIIKKNSDDTLNNEIGKIFRKYNIIEYKSPTDNLTIDDFYKVCGYGLLYKSLSDKVNAIDIKEITLTFCCKKEPKKLIEHLKKVHNYKIKQEYQGIYYIDGSFLPIQIILNTHLNAENHLFLKSLDDDLKDLNLVQSVIHNEVALKSVTNINALLSVIFKANPKTFKEVLKMTNTAELKEVMTEIIYEQGLDKIFIAQGKELGIKQGKELGIQQGREQGEYDKAVNIAKRLLKANLSMEEVSKYTELPMEVIKNL